MEATGEGALLAALEAVAAALRGLSAPSMVIGGIAVIAQGVPRQTVDVDATIWADETDFETIAAVFEVHRIVPRIDNALDFARDRQVLLLRHEPSGTPIDVSLAWLPFELEAMKRAAFVRIGSVDVPIATPEDLVVYKALAWRDRDRSDIERLLVLHRQGIDLERVRDFVRQFSEILGEPGRIPEFEALLARADV